MKDSETPYSDLNYILELTAACNNRCRHCYNIWKLEGHMPGKQLSTGEWKELVDKLYNETKCKNIALSGGEPTLHPGFLEILDHIGKKGIRAVLITNGTNMTKEMVKNCRERGVRVFELPLLGPNKDLHNKISGNDCWDSVISAIVNVKTMGGKVFIVHVLRNDNLPFFEDTLKLAIALETDGMLFNRFNPGGEGIKHIDELLPSAEDYERALEIANRLSYEYRYPISSGIAIPPCIVDMSKYRYIGTGFCGAGTDRSYYTFGPDGTMRPCNHTPTVLGNFLREKFEDMISNDIMKEFMEAVPPLCEPCPMVKTCQGGCKASAETSYGSLKELDPFIKHNLHRHPAYGGEKEYSGEMEIKK